MFDRSKLESLRDVSVTRIGNTLSYGFPQTDLGNFKSQIKSEGFLKVKEPKL